MHVIVIGTGSMAGEYVKVLNSMGVPFSVFGRSSRSIDTFQKKYAINPVFNDESTLRKINFNNTVAIVAVGILDLADSCLRLIEAGCKRILVEKPGGLTLVELKEIQEKALEASANVKVGLNRRFYGSTYKNEGNNQNARRSEDAKF
jgi:predicted dehydrogenase